MSHLRPDNKIELGRTVLYRGPHPGDPVLPATIVGTAVSVTGVDDIPSLMSGRVHLVVLSPQKGVVGIGGTLVAHDVGEDDHVAGEDDHVAGAYLEDDQTNGTWRWPDIV